MVIKKGRELGLLHLWAALERAIFHKHDNTPRTIGTDTVVPSMPAVFSQYPLKLVIFNFCVIFGCQLAGAKEGIPINFQATMKLESPFEEWEMWH